MDFNGLNKAAKEIHAWAITKGFWTHERTRVEDPSNGDYVKHVVNPSIVPEKLMLIDSEVAEVLEAWRDDDSYGIEEELADIIIRVLDLSEYLKVDIEKHLNIKMEKNVDRPYLHGRKH